MSGQDQGAAKGRRANAHRFDTSWVELIRRMRGAVSHGLPIRVQVFVRGDWYYLGGRRPR